MSASRPTNKAASPLIPMLTSPSLYVAWPSPSAPTCKPTLAPTSPLASAPPKGVSTPTLPPASTPTLAPAIAPPEADTPCSPTEASA